MSTHSHSRLALADDVLRHARRNPLDAIFSPKTVAVIPVRNHAGTVRAVVEKSLDAGFPVLLIDDGSTDGSLDAAAGLPIGRHRLPGPLGTGAAILAGASEYLSKEETAQLELGAVKLWHGGGPRHLPCSTPEASAQ